MSSHQQGWMRGAACAAGCGVLLLAALANAGIATGGAAPPAKNIEASIQFANHGGIRDWRADGSKGMWIEAANGRWFYASFSSQCTNLPFGSGVEFVPEPSDVLTRWSSIRLGHQQRCFFRTLQPSAAPPPKKVF